MAGSVVRAACAAVVAVVGMGVVADAARAAPANTEVVETLEQPDGSTLKARLWGDEFLHGYETLNGYTLAFDRRQDRWEYAERTRRGYLRPSGELATRRGEADARPHLRPTRAAFNTERREEGAPALGALAAPSLAPGWATPDTDVLFLIAEFTDVGCSFTPAQHQDNMFGTTASGPGNLDDYFQETSYGAFGLNGRVVGDGADCIALGDTRAHYNTTAGGDDDLVREAVAAVDDDIDFGTYDNDGDGTVDALGIIYAGGGPHDGCFADTPPQGGDGDNLWPHSGGVDTALTADGKTIRPFIINSETTWPVTTPGACTAIQTIGLFAHELGHSLGLPDLYDTDVGTGGVGTWSAMASQYLSTTNLADTPPHYDPWSKAVMGWVAPTVHQPADRLLETLPAASGSSEVHQFRDNPDGFQTGSGAGEYWLVENRQQTGFDRQLPGCGVLVWHVDEAKPDNTQGGHSAAVHRLVDVDEADGLAELDANGEADAGDPFPGSTGNQLFDGTTNPASDLYSGADSGVRMRVKDTACAADMDVAFGPNQPPAADAGGPYTTPEGTDAALSASGSSDPDGDAITYAWDLDGDGQFDDSASATPSFTDVGDDGSHVVRVRVTDAFGDATVDEATVTVSNVAPSAGPLADTGPVDEHTAVTVSGTISDPGWEDDLSATVDWGDGAGAQPVGGGLAEGDRPDATLAVSPSHTYGDNGTYTVAVCGADDDGATTAPCATTTVTVGNVAPTAAIDESGATLINGTPTVLANAGAPTPLTGRSTDPGSDDLTLTWSWDDGSPDTVTVDLVDPPLPDPFESPTVEPRDVTTTAEHLFAACVYDVGFAAEDDDGGGAADTVKVLVVGTADRGRQSGYWAHQYRQRGHVEHSDEQLACNLEITAYISRVFHEARNVATFDRAQKLLFSQGSSVGKRDQLDRDLLTAWLNFASGAVGYAEPVDTTGDGVPDTAFHAAMEQAETVRLAPGATPAQIDAQRVVVNRINDAV